MFTITWRETDLGAHTITRRELWCPNTQRNKLWHPITRTETDFGAHWIRLWSPTPEQRVEELNVTSPTQEHTESIRAKIRGH